MHAGTQAQVLMLSQVRFTDRTFSLAWILCVFGLCRVIHRSKVETPRASDNCPQHVVFNMALAVVLSMALAVSLRPAHICWLPFPHFRLRRESQKERIAGLCSYGLRRSVF